jgi:hypothetical protein
LSSFCDCRDVFPSAYSTPVYPLLQHDFLRTIDFIVEVVNKCIDYAAKYHGEEIGLEKTTVAFSTGEKVEQSISQAVWSMHRGVAGPVVPYLLQSTHMALERYMLSPALPAAVVGLDSVTEGEKLSPLRGLGVMMRQDVLHS